VNGTGRTIESAEQSAIDGMRQASSTEQSVNGAELEMSNTEQSMIDIRARKCLRTERSVDRHGASSRQARSNPSVGGEEGGVKRGAIRNGRGIPGIESREIGERCKALSVEHGEIRCTTRTLSVMGGAIRKCAKRQMLIAESNRQSAWGVEAERGAIRRKRRRSSVERGVILDRRAPQSAGARQLGTVSDRKVARRTQQ